MTLRRFRHWLSFLLVGVWSSAIFEIGLPFFVDRLGFSLFMLFGVLFLGSGLFFIMVVKRGKLPGRLFFQNHKLLLLLYTLYWLIAWFGVLYSPDAARGLLATVQYTWYTVLALLTVLVLFHFSVEERSALFLLIGLSSFLILLYFSAVALKMGVPVSRLAGEEGKFSLSVFRDYNVFTYSLMLSVLLVFLSTKDTYRRVSIAKLFLYMALMLYVTVLGVISGSRRSSTLYGPIAALTPFLLLWTRSLRRFVRATVLSVVVVAMLAVIALNLFSLESAPETIFTNLDDWALTDLNKRVSRGLGFLTGSYSDMSTRTTRWEAAWGIAGGYSVAELLIGRGTRSYLATPEFTRPDGGTDSPHNFLLAALLEGGILKLFVVVSFVVVWLLHVLMMYRGGGFWLMNFLAVSSLLWIVSVLISGQEFFNSKQFLLILVVYAAFWRTGRRGSAVAAQPGLQRGDQ